MQNNIFEDKFHSVTKISSNQIAHRDGITIERLQTPAKRFSQNSVVSVTGQISIILLKVFRMQLTTDSSFWLPAMMPKIIQLYAVKV